VVFFFVVLRDGRNSPRAPRWPWNILLPQRGCEAL
jgi:hypothetical protein